MFNLFTFDAFDCGVLGQSQFDCPGLPPCRPIMQHCLLKSSFVTIFNIVYNKL